MNSVELEESKKKIKKELRDIYANSNNINSALETTRECREEIISKITTDEETSYLLRKYYNFVTERYHFKLNQMGIEQVNKTDETMMEIENVLEDIENDEEYNDVIEGRIIELIKKIDSSVTGIVYIWLIEIIFFASAKGMNTLSNNVFEYQALIIISMAFYALARVAFFNKKIKELDDTRRMPQNYISFLNFTALFTVISFGFIIAKLLGFEMNF